MDAQMLRNHAASTSYCSCSCPLRTPTMPRPNTTSRLAILALRPLLRHTARPGSSCEVRCGSTGAATLQPSSSSAGQEDGQHQWQGQAGGALLLCAAAVGLCAAMAAASGPGSPFMSMTVTAGLGVSREALRASARCAWAGLVAGFLHTLAGADHLAALTPLTIGRSQVKASLLGALWGFGHSTGQLILGLAMVVLKDRFQSLVPTLSKWGGTTVGLTLCAIGALGLYEAIVEQQSSPELAVAGAGAEVLNHSHAPEPTPQDKRDFGMATFVTGVLYGLQPDALFVIIPALTLPTKLAAACYLFSFVIGTVTAMGSYTAFIGATSQAIRKQSSHRFTTQLAGIASAVAMVFGVLVLLSCHGGLDINLSWFNLDSLQILH